MQWIEAWVARKRAGGAPPDVALSEVRPSVRAFEQYVRTGRESLSVVADLRRCDPFGSLTPDPERDLLALAARLDEAEVDGVSIPTDPAWGNRLEDMRGVAEACESLPILHREPLVWPEEVYRSRLAGADAIWLVPAQLEGPIAREIVRTARQTHMAAVAAVYDEASLAAALDSGCPILEVLRCGETGAPDDGRVEEVLATVPDRMAVILAGGVDPEVARRYRGRVDGVVAGRWILAAADPVGALQALKGAQ